MKAMQIVSFDGPASGLRYQEAPTPEPGPGEIAVDVDHAGVGYVEALFTEGLVPIDLPWTPGLEVSGRVRALGDGVDDYRVGDAVVALTITGGGGYGQVAVAPAELVVPLPAGLDPILAAAVPANSTTALVGGHLRRAVELVASGELRVHVTDRLPIQEAAQAVTAVRAGTTTGKIVLTHSQD